MHMHMGFLNPEHFGKAAQDCPSDRWCRTAPLMIMNMYMHVCAKCKKDVHSNFISRSISPALVVAICVHTAHAYMRPSKRNGRVESAGEPSGPSLSSLELLFHLVSTSSEPPSFAPRLRAFANAYSRRQAMEPSQSAIDKLKMAVRMLKSNVLPENPPELIRQDS